MKTHTLSHSPRCIFLLSFLLLWFSPEQTFAIGEPTISDFNGGLEPEFLDGNGDTYGIMAGGMILGNLLDVEVFGTVTVEPTGSAIFYDGSEDSGGTAVLSWDGDDEESLINPEGLGSINLTEEEINFSAQDALLLHFETITTPGSFTLKIFSGEGESSTYSAALSTGSSVNTVVPYAAFSVNEGDGAVFSQVSAIVLTLGGGLAAELDSFETTASLSGITKTDALAVDPGGNSLVDPGDTVRYTITIPASASASGVTVTDTLDTNTTLVVGSVTCMSNGSSYGSVTEGNTTGDTNVVVSVGTLPATSVVITFDVFINDPFIGSSPVSNQAAVTASGLDPVLTDDPDDSTGNSDPTLTTVEVDLTAPDLTIPPDTTIDKGSDTSPSATGEASATDNKTSSPEVTYSDSITQGPVPFQTVITRTWTATDEAGNSTSEDQIITLADTLDHSLVVSQPTYGLFSPLSASANRQIGTIDTDGNVVLLGTNTSLDVGGIVTGAGFTTYDRTTKTVYALGKTSSDDLSRIFAIDVTNGSATNAAISFGTVNSIVGIWWDEISSQLFALFQVGDGLSGRQLGVINPTNGIVSMVGGTNTTISGTIGGICTGSRANGELYFLGTPGGLPGAIYSVDLSSGAMSFSTLSNLNYNAIAGMTFSQDSGILYALAFEGTERRLAELNPQTGEATLIGTNTVAGGGVPITTYTGVNTLDEDSKTYLFIGRYNNGSNNVWAIFGVDVDTGETTLSDIDTTDITAHGFYGLDYGELKEMDITESGFSGLNFYIDVPQGTAHLKITSSDNLVTQAFTDVSGVIETNDASGDPNRFLIPEESRNMNLDFFRVEPE